MQMQSIQSNINFEAKQRFLTQTQKKNINVIIEKMSKETKYETNGIFFKSTRVHRLIIPEKAEFICARIRGNDTRDCDKVHLTVDKTQLVIDASTGNIEDFCKPFFTRWSKVMRSVDKYLGVFMENFNNSKVVQKNRFSVCGMTTEAFENYMRVLDKMAEEGRKKKKL